MRWFRGMAMVLVGVMLFAFFGSAFAEIKDNTISPLYLYTRMVKASLSISDSGKATCVLLQKIERGADVHFFKTLCP